MLQTSTTALSRVGEQPVIQTPPALARVGPEFLELFEALVATLPHPNMWSYRTDDDGDQFLTLFNGSVSFVKFRRWSRWDRLVDFLTIKPRVPDAAVKARGRWILRGQAPEVTKALDFCFHEVCERIRENQHFLKRREDEVAQARAAEFVRKQAAAIHWRVANGGAIDGFPPEGGQS